MDANTVIVGFLLLCATIAGVSAQGDTARNDTTSEESSGLACNTAKGVPGSCVIRRYCEYSTVAIDLTLYAQKGYKKPCRERETCCPNNFQVKITESNALENNDFTFDDDDK